jgi:hypothetical protein
MANDSPPQAAAPFVKISLRRKLWLDFPGDVRFLPRAKRQWISAARVIGKPPGVSQCFAGADDSYSSK